MPDSSAEPRQLPPGVYRLIAAQFFSALADNALLIVGIALLEQQGRPGWWAPLLKLSITVAYVTLAPWVGPLADAWPKARVMAVMNGLKMLAVAALILDANPLWVFGVVGVGAAAYAPAKYGLITELVPPRQLVLANGWLEVSVVGAVLLGTVLGGALVSAPMLQQLAPAVLSQLGLGAEHALRVAMVVVLSLHGLAALLNLRLPDSGARYPDAAWHPVALARELWRGHRVLWHDGEGGLSLAVTTLFWGVAALMQFAVLRWGVDVLGLALSQSAYLQASVAVGVALGATAAGRWVSLKASHRVLPVGVLLGLLLPLCIPVTSVLLALPLMLAVGLAGGFLVVPMNALLQHRGCQLLSAGRSIAVQNFNENASVLAMLALYAGLIALEVRIVPLMASLGVAVAVLMALLIRRERRLAQRAAQPA